MAKHSGITKAVEGDLPALVQEKGRLEALQTKLVADLKDLDPLAADALQRRGRLISEESATSAALEAVGPAIVSAERAVQDLREAERGNQIVCLRSEDMAAFSRIVDATRVLQEAIEGWLGIVYRLQALGTGSFSPRIGPLVEGVRQALSMWRATVPELLGLPRKPTQLQELQVDAVVQCQHVVGLWVAADAGARATRNGGVRRELEGRAKELLSVVQAGQDRCRQLGAMPPSLPGGLMTAIIGFIEGRGRELAQELVGQEEAEFISQSVPGTPGREQAFVNIRDRREP